MLSVGSFASLLGVDAKQGQDVVIGLDVAMQEFVTQRCQGEQSVSIVLLDAASGEVLALMSSPSFDPSAFNNGLRSSYLAATRYRSSPSIVQQGYRRDLSAGFDI